MTDVDAESDGLRILDHRGCLTLDVMCFISQLQPEQRAVVDRHIRSCSLCAQQQMDLARITERLRSARPRVPVPMEARTLARQIALRSLSIRRKRDRYSTARIRVIGRPDDTWYRSRTFWITTAIGLSAAILLAIVAVLFLR